MQEKLPDSRDNRGKRHELAFIIVNFMLSIIRSHTQLSISAISRHMKRLHDELAIDLNADSIKCISRPQLRRVLRNFNIEEFNDLNDKYFKRKVISNTSLWMSIDGKELRGNIDCVLGEKRAENIVLLKNHDSSESKPIGFYSGNKDSERNIVTDFFKSHKDLKNKNYTLDALHTNPNFLKLIDKRKGGYIVQVKANQALLLEEFELLHQHFPSKVTYEKIEKGHGRTETRKAYLYPVENNTIDDRWGKANIKYMICIRRTTVVNKTGKKSVEESFYISNINTSVEVFSYRIRKHWTVEVGNYIRDSNFGEDNIKCFVPEIQQAMASILTTIINQIQKFNTFDNLNIMREETTYKKDIAYSVFARY